MDDEITKNQKENPAVTTNAFIRVDDALILNRINKCYQSTL
jgi:hypothetical protein